MARLRNSYYRKAGFTLIEVLIALAIIGIAMTAIIKAVSQNIKSTAYLQNKTIAMWVGKQVLNEIRVELVKLSGGLGEEKQSTEMLGRTWYWHATQEETPNPRIKKITVHIYNKPNESDDETPIVALETYV